jgi:hypothetical protein
LLRHFAIIEFPKHTEFAMMPLRLLFAALPLTLCACTSTGATGPAGPQRYTLQPGQQLDLGGSATLIYDSVSDSRCPPGVHCIWAGELLYHFTLATPKATESFVLGPGKGDHVSPAGSARLVLDMSRVPPPQQPGAALVLHPVTLTVSHP